MKLTLLLLAFVAVTVNVVYAAPQGDEGEIQDLLKALQQQDDDDDGGENVDIQSLLKNMDDAEEQDDDQAQIEELEDAALQDFFAKEQIPVKLQGWFSRAFKKVRKVVRKVAPYARHAYRLYKMYRRYRG